MFPQALVSCRQCHCTVKRVLFNAVKYSTSAGYNDGILEMLRSEQKQEQAKSAHNGYKLKKYAVAIQTISELQYPIQSAKDLVAIDGIGPGISQRILKHIASASESPSSIAEYERTKIADELRTLPKIGKLTAQLLVQAGCRGIQDVVKDEYFSLLTPLQQRHVQDALSGPESPRTTNISRHVLEPDEIKVVDELKSLLKMKQPLAEKLVKAGCRGVQDALKEEFFSLLPPLQRLHIQHAASLNHPVTVEEVNQLADYIRDSISSDWEVIPIGAIRRGAKSDDTGVHLLLVHPESGLIPPPSAPYGDDTDGHKSRVRSSIGKGLHRKDMPLHKTVIPTLRELGLLAQELYTRQIEWHGVVRIPQRDDKGAWETLRQRKDGLDNKSGSFRRVRLVAAPLQSRGAMMLVETGDGKMWRRMRMKAHTLGMLLDSNGLWKWRADVADIEEGNGYWELLQSSTEEEIFERIGMDWVDPRRRNLKFVS